MALTADYTAIEGYDSLTEDECVTRDALVWASMAVGIYHLTDEKVDEFFTRVSFWERISGAYRYMDGEALYLTREDVARFVGLRTNASAKTEAAFRKDTWDVHKRFNCYK